MHNDKTSSLNTGRTVISQLKNLLFKGLDSFFDYADNDNEFSKIVKPLKSEAHPIEEEGRQGYVIPMEYLGGNDITIQVKLFPVADQTDIYYIQVEAENCETFDNHGKVITMEDIDDIVTEFCERNLDVTGTNEGKVNGSKVLQVALVRVVGSKDDTVNMTAIHANYNIAEALGDLDNVLNQPTFVATLSTDPTPYEITQDNDEYNIEVLDSLDAIDTSNSYMDMFRAAVEIRNNLQAIHWGSKGEDFYTLHNTVGDIIDELDEQIDELGELVVEKTNIIPHPSNCGELAIVATANGFTLDEGLSIVKELIDQYVMIIDTQYVNLDRDIQSEVDDWIRQLKKLANYFIRRQQTK